MSPITSVTPKSIAKHISTPTPKTKPNKRSTTKHITDKPKSDISQQQAGGSNLRDIHVTILVGGSRTHTTCLQRWKDPKPSIKFYGEPQVLNKLPDIPSRNHSKPKEVKTKPTTKKNKSIANRSENVRPRKKRAVSVNINYAESFKKVDFTLTFSGRSNKKSGIRKMADNSARGEGNGKVSEEQDLSLTIPGDEEAIQFEGEMISHLMREQSFSLPSPTSQQNLLHLTNNSLSNIQEEIELRQSFLMQQIHQQQIIQH